MTTITYIAHDGTRFEVQAENGSTVMENAIKHAVPGIEAECGGACACATCHVHVDPAWIEKVGRLKEGEAEAELLQFAEGASEYSRLACQIPMEAAMEGLVLHVPAQQY